MFGHRTTLPLSTWDRDTLRAVAVAYRGHRRIGALQSWAVDAAQRAYLDHHPDVPADEARQTVILMIAAVARDHPAWLWKGVGTAQ